jgi:hypothetical protein
MKLANPHARRGALASLAFAAFVASRAASAQAVDPAREAFEAGVRSLAERRFGDAAAALERSRALRALPVVHYNLALAYRGMGRYNNAITAFEAYLAAPDPSEAPERLAAIREEVSDLRAHLVTLTLATTPADATVSIDGHPLPAGTTAVTLDPGPHAVDVVRLAHRPAHHELTGAPGARVPLTVSLAPIREGRLQVECAVPAARIEVDGASAARGRALLPLPPGEHRVAVSAEGYLPYRRTVVVGFTGTVRLDVTLVERPNLALRWGLVAGGAAAVIGAAVAVALLWPETPGAHMGTWDNVVAP